MTSSYPEFDAVYSTSDLHLGGAPGFQIFHQGELLAALIDRLAGGDGGRSVALVLNGDIVDFLAEEPGRYLDTSEPVAKLERVMKDPAFAPVFRALRGFVRVERRSLVLVLGNHDVELALPPVRDQLREFLCGTDAAARSRLHFAMDGTGFRCRVRAARVLFLHGNEFDPFNIVDYGALLETSRALVRELRAPDWSPNAGTRLVIDVMNGVKKRFRWVDLLKPEVEAVIPILVAIDPSSLAALRHFGRIGFSAAWGAAQAAGLLSVEDARREGPGKTDLELLSVLEGTMPDLREEIEGDTARWALKRVEREFAAGKSGLDLLGGQDERLLGFWSRIGELATERGREVMRRGLKALIGDAADLAPEEPDATSRRVDERIGPGIDFVLAGHTHVRKALRRERGGGFYFNTGSWIDLIQLTPPMLDDEAAFGMIWQALEKGSYEALDVDIPVNGALRRLIGRKPTLVRIEAVGTSVTGSLCDVKANGEPEPIGDPFAVPKGS